MKVLIPFCVLISIFFYVLCAGERNSLQDMNYEQCSAFVSKIIFKIIPIIEKKYEVKLIGYGGSERDDRVGWEKLTFKSYDQLTTALGREIIMESTELLLQALRESNAASCFQHNRIDPEIIQVGVIGGDRDEKENESYIKSASMVKGSISYYDCLGLSSPFKEIYEESYEEALKIVRGEKE